MTLLQKLFPVDDLKETVLRFPLSVACALALFVIAILSIHDIVDFNDEVIGRVVVVLGALYFWFGIVQLARESEALYRVKHLAVSIAGACGIAGLAVSGPLWWMHFWFFTPALLLVIMFAAYLKGGDDLSVWFFNRKMWFGVLVSYVALLLFAGGLCMALWAVEELFGLDMPEEVFGDIWAFACLVLGPLYALSWVPKTFQFSEEDCHDPPGLKFIVNWISAPMVFIYLAILYAYFIKIVVTGEVPNGHLAYMISGFVGAGIVTYLAAHPLREEGSPQLRLFFKVFFPALLVPVAFHFYAIWERVSAYGITEQRYMLLVSAIWFAFLAVGHTFWRLPIKTIPMVLAGLMILASFGPWGAVSVSGTSQMARLEAVLVKNELLKDGKAVELENADEVLSFEDRQDISSILQYICRTERDDLIENWFEVEEGKEFSCYAYELTKLFGFEFVSHYHREQTAESEYITLQGAGRNNKALDVSGYKLFLSHSYIYIGNNMENWKQEWGGDPSVSARYKDHKFVVAVEGHGEVAFDVDAFARAEVEKSAGNEPRDLTLERSNGALRARLIFNSITLQNDVSKPEGERLKLQNFNLQALVDY